MNTQKASPATAEMRPGSSVSQLTEQHRREFAEVKIPDDVLAANGIRSVDRDEANRLLERRNCPSGGWALGTGHPTFTTVKLDTPLTDKKGKPRKYEYPIGRESCALFPAGFDHSASRIAITEGVKKSLAVQMHGLDCIGLAGTYNFHRKRPRDQFSKAYGLLHLIEDLESVDWSGKTVHVLYDSDVIHKSSVLNAEYRLAEVLRLRGATVTVCRIPPPSEGKHGIDDYLALQDEPAAALTKLCTDAKEPTKPPKPSPMDLGRELLRVDYTSAGIATLRYHRQTFYEFDGRAYREIMGDGINGIVMEWLDRYWFESHTRATNEVVNALRTLCTVPWEREPPVELVGDTWCPSADIIMYNGVIDLDDTTVRPHTPRLFSTNAMTYSFDPGASCPQWLRFLGEVLDPQSITLLQEWFGYCLAPDTSLHKFMLFVGEGANGKSVTLDVLEALVGKASAASVPIELFGERFALGTTVGKLVNIAPDTGDSLPRGAEALLKQFVAGDAITIDRKNKTAIEVRPTARVTMAANSLPRWFDRSEGIWRRQLVIPFGVTITADRMDHQLRHRIIRDEMPGVFGWSLEGRSRLWQNGGQFARTEVGEQLTEQHRREANPAREFLLENYEEGPSSLLKTQDVYTTYVEWCRDSGHRPLGKVQFGKEVFRAFRGVKNTRMSSGIERPRAYENLRSRSWS